MIFAASIGEKICKGPIRKLTKEEAKTLVVCAMMAEEPLEEQVAAYRQCLQGAMLLAILDARFNFAFGPEQKFAPNLLMWMSTLADRPSVAVLQCTILAYMIQQGEDLTMQNVIRTHFADGIPTAENYMAAWDAQKRNDKNEHLFVNPETKEKAFTDNLLDLRSSWHV